MKTFENISNGDFVVFYKEYLRVAPVLEIKGNNYKISDGIFLPFEIKQDEILAIGNNGSGKGIISGFRGKYDILNQKKIDEILKKENNLLNQKL